MKECCFCLHAMSVHFWGSVEFFSEVLGWDLDIILAEVHDTPTNNSN